MEFSCQTQAAVVSYLHFLLWLSFDFSWLEELAHGSFSLVTVFSFYSAHAPRRFIFIQVPLQVHALTTFDRSRYRTRLYLNYFARSLPHRRRLNLGYRNNSAPVEPRRGLLPLLFCGWWDNSSWCLFFRGMPYSWLLSFRALFMVFVQSFLPNHYHHHLNLSTHYHYHPQGLILFLLSHRCLRRILLRQVVFVFW